jgi:hypothetical protein
MALGEKLPNANPLHLVRLANMQRHPLSGSRQNFLGTLDKQQGFHPEPKVG